MNIVAGRSNAVVEEQLMSNDGNGRGILLGVLRRSPWLCFMHKVVLEGNA